MLISISISLFKYVRVINEFGWTLLHTSKLLKSCIYCKQVQILSVFHLYNMTDCRYKHTYLAQGTPWSLRRFPQGEACPLHFGRADLCDHPKCGWLGCVIYVSGGLRSRYPLIIKQINQIKTILSMCVSSFLLISGSFVLANSDAIMLD